MDKFIELLRERYAQVNKDIEDKKSEISVLNGIKQGLEEVADMYQTAIASAVADMQNAPMGTEEPVPATVTAEEVADEAILTSED